MVDDAVQAYAARQEATAELCSRLELRVKEVLDGFHHIDRIAFRPKSVESFAKKSEALADTGQRKYAEPLRQIEDQVAGRVIVFFRDDLTPVTERLASELGPIEAMHKEPVGDAEFGYESDHFIFVIPN